MKHLITLYLNSLYFSTHNIFLGWKNAMKKLSEQNQNGRQRERERAPNNFF